MRALKLISTTALLLSTGLACDPIDPTPLDIGEDPLYGGDCVEEVTILAGLDADSPMPFTGADLMAFAQGEHSSPMLWGEGIDDTVTSVSFGPESGAGKISVGIGYDGGEVRYVQSSYPDSDGFYGDCVDHLEVDVAVHLATADGAFDESFSAPLAASISRIAVLRHSLELDALGGSLTVTPKDPDNAEVSPIDLEVGITADGLFGYATSTVEVAMDDFIAATFLNYAQWPGGDQGCEYNQAPLDLESPAAGFSGADILDRFAQAGPLEITWGDGETTSLELGLVGSSSTCASIVDGTMQLDTTASITSGDKRWDGSFPMQIWGTPNDDGTLGSARIEIEAPYAAQIDAEKFAEHYGLWDVDLAGYDAGILSFSAEFEVDGDSTVAAGTFEVLGVHSHECPPDANGCAGDDYVSIESGSWGTP